MKEFTCINPSSMYCWQKREFSLPFIFRIVLQRQVAASSPARALHGLRLQCCLPEPCPATGTCSSAAPSHCTSQIHWMEGLSSSCSLCAPKLCLASIPARCGGSHSAQSSARDMGSLHCVAMTLFALRHAAHGSIWLYVWFVCLL